MSYEEKSSSWRLFSEARAFVHALKLKNKAQWQAYSKSSVRPHDIPSNPAQVYSLEFKGYGDWLGTGTIATFNRRYRPFPEARALVHTLNLKSIKAWREYCKSGQKPPDIPTMPERYGSDFKDYGDWLGTGNIAPTKRAFRPFAEARSYVRSLKLKDQDEWLAYCKSGQKPADIPSNPDRTYLAEFESYGDWLGNDNIHRGKITYRPFTEARAFVRTLGLKDHDDWLAYCRSGEKPIYIPSKPEQVYSDEYQGMKDWLGVVDKWNNKMLLTFLQDLQPQLDYLTKKDLVLMLQENGALNPFRKVLGGVTSTRVLNDLVKNEGRDLEQALRKTHDHQGEMEMVFDSKPAHCPTYEHLFYSGERLCTRRGFKMYGVDFGCGLVV